MASAAKQPGRRNEDFTGATPAAAVLVDGAGIPDSEHTCSHGVAWYADQLGGCLLGLLINGVSPKGINLRIALGLPEAGAKP